MMETKANQSKKRKKGEAFGEPHTVFQVFFKCDDGVLFAQDELFPGGGGGGSKNKDSPFHPRIFDTREDAQEYIDNVLIQRTKAFYDQKVNVEIKEWKKQKKAGGGALKEEIKKPAIKLYRL